MKPQDVIGSDLLAGYDPLAPYVSMPMAADWTAAAQMLGLGNKAASQAFALENFRSFASVSRSCVANVATSVGVPDWLLKPMETFFTQIPLVKDGKTLAEGLVAGITSSVDGALAQCATAVPIIGAILKLGISIWQTIAEQINAPPPEGRPPDTAVLYNIGDDTAQGNLLRGFAAQDDWTPLFLPPSSDPTFYAKPVAWVPGTRAAGTEWGSVTDNSGGMGLFPGIGEQIGVFQVPFADGGIPNVFIPITTTGAVMPSGRKFATMLWQQIMRPSVSMFGIDSGKIADAWHGYYDALWRFADRKDFGIPGDANRDEKLRWAIRKSASFARLDPCPGFKPSTKATGIGPTCPGGFEPVFAKVSTIAAFSTGKLEKKLGKTHVSYRYSDIVRYVCAIHRERAWAACRTLFVAYVSPDAPLLKAEPALAQYHETMRRVLLTHKARYAVELDLVPDADYRTELWRRRIAADVDLTAKSGVGGVKEGASLELPNPPGTKPPPADPAPPPGLPDGTDTAAGSGSGTGWFAAGGVVLAVVGGVIVAKKLRR